MSVKAAWYRWKQIRDRINWVLVLVSVWAATRGVLYTIPSDERIPRGLDLVPRGALTLFGLLWLAAAFCAFAVAARPITDQKWARRFLAGMFISWASIYSFATILPSDNRLGFAINTIAYIVLAGLAWASKLTVITEYKTIFIVHGVNDDPGFVMIEPEDLEKPDAK